MILIMYVGYVKNYFFFMLAILHWSRNIMLFVWLYFCYCDH